MELIIAAVGMSILWLTVILIAIKSATMRAKASIDNDLSKAVLYHFKQDNASPELTNMIDYHKNRDIVRYKL